MFNVVISGYTGKSLIFEMNCVQREARRYGTESGCVWLNSPFLMLIESFCNLGLDHLPYFKVGELDSNISPASAVLICIPWSSRNMQNILLKMNQMDPPTTRHENPYQ
jgi:hypothetical protein